MFKRVPGSDAPGTSSTRGGRGSTFTRRPGRHNLTGLFANGIWHCDCDCDPRLPAEHFQVKKESANKGRWFYTCQSGHGRKCGFFLWDDDAKPREAAAVLSNSPSQKTQPSPNASCTLRHESSSALKRSFSDAGLDDADTFPWPLSSQEEVQLLDAPQTPPKAVKLDTLVTPATSTHRKLPWLEYSAPRETPSKASNIHLSHLKSSVAQDSALTPQLTPSPSCFRDASADAVSPPSTLIADVFAVLDFPKITLSSELSSKLRNVLTQHELRIQGLSKGRHITRLALKARDAKVIELQATIARLEAQRDVDRAQIENLEWEKHVLVGDSFPDAAL